VAPSFLQVALVAQLALVVQSILPAAHLLTQLAAQLSSPARLV
jgi:hypothetical protein